MVNIELAKWDAAFRLPQVEPAVSMVSATIKTLSPNNQFEQGGQELIYELSRKPPTRFTLPLETYNLKAYYQPPLTPKEIAYGAEQPANIAGSFAFYSSHLWGNKYKTGKIGQLTRPLSIDADGNKAWASWNPDLSKGLELMLPSDFLDSAVYPVTIDPTFGKTSAGANAHSCEDRLDGCKYTITENASSADSIGVFLKRSGAAGTWSVKCAIYKSSDLSYVDDTEEDVGVAAGAAFAEYTFNFPAPKQPLTGSTEYVLDVWGNADGAGTLSSSYDAGDAGQWIVDYRTYNGWPNPMVQDDTGAYALGIYCTYTAAGGGMTGGVMGGHYYAASGLMTKIRRG